MKSKVDKLVPSPIHVVKKRVYNTKIKNSEDKIPDIIIATKNALILL